MYVVSTVQGIQIGIMANRRRNHIKNFKRPIKNFHIFLKDKADDFASAAGLKAEKKVAN